MVVKVGWRRSRWWLVVTIVENFLGAEPFRSVSEGTGGTGLGAWADLSRVAQSMGRSRIGEKDGGFFQRPEVLHRRIFEHRRGWVVEGCGCKEYWPSEGGGAVLG